MSDIVDDAEELISKCFGEYIEVIPQREIMNGFAMLPVLVAEIKRLRDHSVRYLERLEAEFLDHAASLMYYESIPGVSDYWSWHDYPEDPCKQWFRDQAQIALTKIREGK